MIGGISMRLNQKEEPTKLGRDNDYPSQLAWITTQFVAFHDIADCRTWLVDGASALLHLVRVSLHLDATNPESTYDWVYDNHKLKDVWPDSSGRVASKKTLKDWDNLSLPVYVKSQSYQEGKPVKVYSTFGERVNKVLHLLDLLIDRQMHMIAQDGIRISQTLDRRKGIFGFDVLDLLTPRGPITSRTARFDSWGDGWIDFLPAIGIVSIFGNGYGDLIRPDNLDIVCTEWQVIPKRSDLLVSSVSTLKLLHETHLQRLQPGLRTGELTREILWSSPHQPFEFCNCVKGKQAGKQEHCDPVQFMVSRSSMFKMKDSTPVDLFQLNAEGAVVFANLSLFGRRIHAKSTDQSESKLQTLIVSSASNHGSASLATATSASTIAQSSGSTVPTEQSISSASAKTAQGSSPKSKDKSIVNRLKEKWGTLSSSKRYQNP